MSSSPSPEWRRSLTYSMPPCAFSPYTPRTPDYSKSTFLWFSRGPSLLSFFILPPHYEIPSYRYILLISARPTAIFRLLSTACQIESPPERLLSDLFFPSTHYPIKRNPVMSQVFFLCFLPYPFYAFRNMSPPTDGASPQSCSHEQIILEIF